MKRIILSLFIALIANYTLAQIIVESDSTISLKNSKQELLFDLKSGQFSIVNAKNIKVVDKAFFQLGGIQSKEKQAVRSYSSSDVLDALGKGKMLTVKVEMTNYVDIIWQATLYGEGDFVVFNMGVSNASKLDYRLMQFYPLISSYVYKDIDNTHNYRVLEGTGGGGRTLVRGDKTLTSFNNLLVRMGENSDPHILVAGGITYNEFEKFVTVEQLDKRLSLKLFSEDPVGKLIDAGKTYILNEKFYLNVNNRDPFTALENYASILKIAQQIKLNMYHFPTECLWYASFYNNEKGRRKFNDSKGAVEEMNNAIATGITKYTDVAIRLVPDSYEANNQQGWWDDKHWAMYGQAMSTEGPHYIEPYITTKNWAQDIIKKGGIPITYFQSGRRSEDYAIQYPEHMLFNDSYRAINMPERFTHRVTFANGYDKGYFNHWWTDKMLWSYDFTDAGFIKHMNDVFANLSEAGIGGIMYDYPEVTAYAFEGGFEDRYKTTAWAYRNMFQLAYDGLGEKAYLDERNLLRGSDITLGLVASQRTWADTDAITPEMVTRSGLRWYKNRVVVNYDMDSKDPSAALPKEYDDGTRSLLTMTYVTSARFLLGISFKQLSKSHLHDLSRTFPYHISPQSARPLDAFKEGVLYPQIYDFEVNPLWHQLTFYNHNLNKDSTSYNTISVTLGASLNEGGMELDTSASYYVYDFWNNNFVGIYDGNQTLTQTLREGEARMMSVHRKENHPQFISTNRHIMQGYVDMKECNWDNASNSLKGVSATVEGEPYKVIIAANGRTVKSSKSDNGKVTITRIDDKHNLYEFTILSQKTKDTNWLVTWH